MMSLPTYAKFIKDGVTVAVGFCNIGWVFSPNGLLDCIFESWSDANLVFDSGCVKPFAYQFGTKEEFQNFEFMYVYNFKIPKDVVDEIVKGSMPHKVFNEMLNEGKFSVDAEEHAKVMASTKSLVEQLKATNTLRNPQILAE